LYDVDMKAIFVIKASFAIVKLCEIC
jgi:hypothetical protein